MGPASSTKQLTASSVTEPLNHFIIRASTGYKSEIKRTFIPFYSDRELQSNRNKSYIDLTASEVPNIMMVGYISCIEQFRRCIERKGVKIREKKEEGEEEEKHIEVKAGQALEDTTVNAVADVIRSTTATKEIFYDQRYKISSIDTFIESNKPSLESPDDRKWLGTASIDLYFDNHTYVKSYTFTASPDHVLVGAKEGDEAAIRDLKFLLGVGDTESNAAPPTSFSRFHCILVEAKSRYGREDYEQTKTEPKGARIKHFIQMMFQNFVWNNPASIYAVRSTPPKSKLEPPKELDKDGNPTDIIDDHAYYCTDKISTRVVWWGKEENRYFDFGEPWNHRFIETEKPTYGNLYRFMMYLAIGFTDEIRTVTRECAYYKGSSERIEDSIKKGYLRYLAVFKNMKNELLNSCKKRYKYNEYLQEVVTHELYTARDGDFDFGYKQMLTSMPYSINAILEEIDDAETLVCHRFF